MSLLLLQVVLDPEDGPWFQGKQTDITCTNTHVHPVVPHPRDEAQKAETAVVH